MTHADGAVVGGSLGVPIVHESAGTPRESVTAVGVADFKDQTRDRISSSTWRRKQLVGEH